MPRPRPSARPRRCAPIPERDFHLREATEADFEQIWPFFREIVGAGETYALPRDLDRGEAVELWLRAPQRTFVGESTEGEILGTYYLKPNALGPGAHVCNCGYMVSAAARGRGVATAMCRHSQQVAIDLGYRAMQFNSVVATNTGAIRLWQSLGFEVVGRLPRAFAHPTQGDVDCLVMYKWLDQVPGE